MLHKDQTFDIEKLDGDLDQFILEERNLDQSASLEIKHHLLEKMEKQYHKITDTSWAGVVCDLMDAVPIAASHFSDNPVVKNMGMYGDDSWKLKQVNLENIKSIWIQAKSRINDLRFDDWAEGLAVFNREGFEAACLFLLNRPEICIPKRAII